MLKDKKGHGNGGRRNVSTPTDIESVVSVQGSPSRRVRDVSRAQDEILDRIEKNKSSGHACFHCYHGFHWWSLLYSCCGITALTGLDKRSAKRVANEIRAAGFKVHVSSCGEFLTVSWS